MYGERRVAQTVFGGQDHGGDLSIDGRVATFRRNFEGIGYADVDWIDLAQ